MKHLIIFTYVLLLILLASATIIEHHQGSAFVSDHIYTHLGSLSYGHWPPF